MLGPCFVVQYFVCFLVLQSSSWGRERRLLYFRCFPDVTFTFLCVFLAEPWVGPCSVIVAFSGHTGLLEWGSEDHLKA